MSVKVVGLVCKIKAAIAGAKLVKQGAPQFFPLAGVHVGGNAIPWGYNTVVDITPIIDRGQGPVPLMPGEPENAEFDADPLHVELLVDGSKNVPPYVKFDPDYEFNKAGFEPQVKFIKDQEDTARHEVVLTATHSSGAKGSVGWNVD